MRTAHLIHGFNVSDGGSDSVGRLLPYLSSAGFHIHHHSYGWVGLFRLRWRNEKATRRILRHVMPGDILVGHSNGCLVCWELVEAGARPGAVVCIQAALRRDTKWPDALPVLNLYNPTDYVVTLGRWWGRFWSVANPFRDAHGWGAAGRHGFDHLNARSRQWNTSVEPYPSKGHSGVFKTLPLHWWATNITQWLKRTLR